MLSYKLDDCLVMAGLEEVPYGIVIQGVGGWIFWGFQDCVRLRREIVVVLDALFNSVCFLTYLFRMALTEVGQLELRADKDTGKPLIGSSVSTPIVLALTSLSKALFSRRSYQKDWCLQNGRVGGELIRTIGGGDSVLICGGLG